jgi:hypothetical protein
MGCRNDLGTCVELRSSTQSVCGDQRPARAATGLRRTSPSLRMCLHTPDATSSGHVLHSWLNHVEGVTGRSSLSSDGLEMMRSRKSPSPARISIKIHMRIESEGVCICSRRSLMRYGPVLLRDRGSLTAKRMPRSPSSCAGGLSSGRSWSTGNFTSLVNAPSRTAARFENHQASRAEFSDLAIGR